MKTPKRIIPCPKCGAPCELGISVIESWDERYEVTALFCTRSGEEVVGNAKAICARWTRKNREARLKHALQRQAWNAVMLAADLRCAELSARSWKKRYREIWRMQFWTTSAYGQDIEGS